MGIWKRPSQETYHGKTLTVGRHLQSNYRAVKLCIAPEPRAVGRAYFVVQESILVFERNLREVWLAVTAAACIHSRVHTHHACIG